MQAVPRHGIEAAAAALRGGDVVAFPTETVYGLGAHARSEAGLARVYALKGRPRTHPLIVHLAAAAALPDWARQVPEAALRLAEAFWPGPLTLVLPRAAGVSDLVTGGQDTVALRVPAHPVAQALLAALGDGIAAPSANRYGHVSPTCARHVREEFGDELPLVLDGGECEVGLESTIVACLGGTTRLLRPGRITLSQVAAVAGAVHGAGAAELPRVPGSTAAHYAPRTPLRLAAAAGFDALAARLAAGGRRVAVLARHACPATGGAQAWIDAAGEVDAYAHGLYARLRELDHAGADCLLVEQVPAGEAWDAVRDRLQRAAAATVATDELDSGDLP